MDIKITKDGDYGVTLIKTENYEEIVRNVTAIEALFGVTLEKKINKAVKRAYEHEKLVNKNKEFLYNLEKDDLKTK